MNQVTDAEYEEAQENINYKKIMHAASGRFKKIIPPNELKRCKLMGLWEALRRFDPSYNRKFTSYLYDQVKYQCLKYISMNSRWTAECISNQYDFEAPSENKDLKMVLTMLTPEEQELINQRFIMRMTLKEIGEANGYSHEIARRRINDIIKILKENL